MLSGMMLLMRLMPFLTVGFASFVFVHFDFMVHVPQSVQYSSDIFAQYLILVVRIIPTLLQHVYLVLNGLHPLIGLFPPEPVHLLLASALLPPLFEAPNFLTNNYKGRLILVSDHLRQFFMREVPQVPQDLIPHYGVHQLMVEASMLLEVLGKQGIHIWDRLFNTPKNFVRNSRSYFLRSVRKNSCLSVSRQRYSKADLSASKE
jgi:hypothetical protein